jgi:hypothetical protein
MVRAASPDWARWYVVDDDGVLETGPYCTRRQAEDVHEARVQLNHVVYKHLPPSDTRQYAPLR